MSLLDSMSTSAPISVAKRVPRARRAEAVTPAIRLEIQPLPRWARSQGADPGAAAFSAGAGLALFDQILRGADGGEPVYAGCLRQRLALRAADSCATLARLREDAGALRDAEHLPGGGETSPAGRLHRVFRLYAPQGGRFDAAILRAAELLEVSVAIDASALAAAAVTAPDPLMAAARASAAAMKPFPIAADAEVFAFVVADLALASRLAWARPIPLLAVAILHPSLRRGAGSGEMGRERTSRPRPTDDNWAESVARAYGRAVVEAHALAVDLARRAQKVLAVAPMLRAKGAGRVVEMLLADDAVTPAAAASHAGLSDRAARRLFDRLVALGAARELTGRETFRIYGL
ncbi:DUF1403 family protein [Methylocystis parvus]|uniref:DUF1403 family protein n=1 Tax=Methylocystis parvus TaxID=134 RepID=A0A6B8MEP5_9HYPH|nr:DUF1403 family protein [Methylocystis parvus]QGN00020.1 DUF1403 family protein [Methylocystis parvus]WBK02485.1 DUF1403 family protein [Methylocystis parvus OBBP]